MELELEVKINQIFKTKIHVEDVIDALEFSTVEARLSFFGAITNMLMDENLKVLRIDQKDMVEMYLNKMLTKIKQ